MVCPVTPGERRLAGSINVGDHHTIGIVEGARQTRFAAPSSANNDAVETSSARVCVRRTRGRQRRADFRGMMRVIVDEQETVALIFDFKPAPRVSKRRNDFAIFSNGMPSSVASAITPRALLTLCLPGTFRMASPSFSSPR